MKALTIFGRTLLLFGLVFAMEAALAGAPLPVVNLTSADTSADEAGQDPGMYTVSRDSAGAALTVGLSFAGSATLNADYSAPGLFSGAGFSQAVMIPAGDMSADFSITPILDNLIETGGEDVVITLLASVNGDYTLGGDIEVTLTIADDVAEVTLTSNDLIADEAGQDPASYTLTRSNNGNVDSPLTVGLSFAGSATVNADYSRPGVFSGAGFSQAVMIPGGDTSADFSITPLLDNLIETGGEDVVITLLASVNGNYTVGADTEVTITIADDVAEVNLTSTDLIADEAGQDPASYTLTRSDNGNVDSTMIVGLTFAGSATLNTDYSAPGVFSAGSAQAVQIPTGQLSATFMITPSVDGPDNEGDETIEIGLLAGDYLVGSQANVTLTLRDLLEFLFADSFETTEKCSALSLAESNPERFLDLGPIIVDLESQLSWSACGLRGGYDWLSGQCWDDAHLKSLDSETLLSAFNAGLIGDGGGFADWRIPDDTDQASLPAGCQGLLVRDD